MNRIAVIGLGNISIRHRKNLRNLYPSALIYGMSASGQGSAEIVSDCDVLVGTTEELVAHQIDFAIIASPATLHATHAIPLIKAGIPVLIEKPVAASVADANAIRAASREYNTPVAIAYCLRYLPSALKMKELLNTHKIGRVYNAIVETGQYLPDWRPSKDFRNCVSARAELGGGVLLELSHELDYIQWLLGHMKVEHAVLRSSTELGLLVEDLADIVACSVSGTLTSIHLDFLQKKAHRRCRFIGSKGCLEWDLIQNSVTLNSTDGAEVIYCDSEWDKNQMYLRMTTDFVHLIQGNEHRAVDIDTAIQTVELIEEIKTYAPIR